MTRREFLKALAAVGGYLALSRMAFAEVAVTEGEYNINPSFVTRGNGFGNRIAITFDDGPTPGVTEPILEELRKHDLRATFFMIGKNVEHAPSLAKQVADAGHEVANHSYGHPMLTRLPLAQVEYEIQKTQDAIFKATGKTPIWFRPPYGAFDKAKHGPIARDKGLGIVYWSVDPQDWKKPGADAIASRVINATTPGSIILLHDLHLQTAQAVPRIFETLKEKAFAFSNLTRFLGKPYV
ncbi:MAG: polysaccharide deacetylase family protein [Verrucomicrobiota bacterium]